MAIERIIALVNTVIKQSTLDSSLIIDPLKKFTLAAGSELEINSSISSDNNHWQLELTTPINGVTQWFAYMPHVKIAAVNSITDDILAEIKSNTSFNVYHQPTAQDVEGLGIPSNGRDNRSERICPVYVLSPRRQTDSLVRQLLALLPTRDTAFIVAERFVQYPEDYLPIVSQFQQAILIQSFVGIGNASSYPDWAKKRHAMETWRIEQSIRLLQSKNIKIISVVCAMGDSPSLDAPTVRTAIQTNLHALLDRYSLSALKKPVTWGADELVAMAMAQTLPLAKVKINIANNDTKLHYDANKKPSEVIAEKLPVIGLEETRDDDWDFEVAVLTRRKNGSTSDYQTNDTEQATLDKDFLEQYRSYSVDKLRKLVIVDARLFNGAWNADSVLQSCDLLSFGSWGTFGNCFGSTLAAAKILLNAKNLMAQKQLYLEAVAHDVFANGYKEAQRKSESNSFAAKLLRDENIVFNHSQGYPTEAITQKVFSALNRHVNDRMKTFFPQPECFEERILQFTPQLWRTFESEVHIWPRLDKEIHRVGVYRTDLISTVFNPVSSPIIV